MITIKAEPLTNKAFIPFGNVIEISNESEAQHINAGTTERFHDLATAIATGGNARVIISMARAQPFKPPFMLDMLERHPDGSQAFIPVMPKHFLITVAQDEDGKPGMPRAFLAKPGQGINYLPNTWHGVLRALDGVTNFVVVDRAGDGVNLEEHHFSEPYRIDI